MNNRSIKPLRSALVLLLLVAISACGGGGGSAGTVPGTASSSGVAATDPLLTLAIVDGSGVAITTLSGGQSGVARTKLTDGSGAAIASAIVKFTTTDAILIEFTPVSASALTDAGGIAVMNIKPADFTSSGALAITATAVVATKTATASSNIAVGAAPLTVGVLSWALPPAGRLQAFSTLALTIPVSSGGAPANSVAALIVTSLCVGDGTASIVLGALASGNQSATYTNNGCLRGTDVVTVSIGNSIQTISIAVDPANIGTV